MEYRTKYFFLIFSIFLCQFSYGQVVLFDINTFINLDCHNTVKIDTIFDSKTGELSEIISKDKSDNLVRRIRFQLGNPWKLEFFCGGEILGVIWHPNGTCYSIARWNDKYDTHIIEFYESGRFHSETLSDSSLNLVYQYSYCEDGLPEFIYNRNNANKKVSIYYCQTGITEIGELEEGYIYKGEWLIYNNKNQVLSVGEYRNAKNLKRDYEKIKIGTWKYYDQKRRLQRVETFDDEGNLLYRKYIRPWRRSFYKRAPKIPEMS